MGGEDNEGMVGKIDLIEGYEQITLSANINIQRRKLLALGRSKPSIPHDKHYPKG